MCGTGYVHVFCLTYTVCTYVCTTPTAWNADMCKPLILVATAIKLYSQSAFKLQWNLSIVVNLWTQNSDGYRGVACICRLILYCTLQILLGLGSLAVIEGWPANTVTITCITFTVTVSLCLCTILSIPIYCRW